MSESESSKTLMAKVELSQADLIILQNALNEVLNGLNQAEFETRMGASRREVLVLHDRVHQVAKQLVIGAAARLG
jgi:hypothetical protein